MRKAFTIFLLAMFILPVLVIIFSGSTVNRDVVEKADAYFKQDITETASGLNKLRDAETNDAIQDSLNQRNERPACQRYDLCFFRSCFLIRNEITACRDQAEDISLCAKHPGS